MYNNGLGTAVIIGLVAFLTPVLWIAWWLVADLGQKVSGSQSTVPHTRSDRDLPRAA